MLTFIYIAIETAIIFILTLLIATKIKRVEKGYTSIVRNKELKFEDSQMNEILSNIYFGNTKMPLELTEKGQIRIKSI